MRERRIYFGLGEPRLSDGWVDCGVRLIIHDNEVLGPEHLAELGAIFEKCWAAFGSPANSERLTEERAQLACTVLRLYGLRQLGPDQVMQTALRLLKPSTPVVNSASDGKRH